jgi:hypothetical protein
VYGHTGADGAAIVSLERKPDGTFTAVGLRYTDRAASPPGANHAPGPISRGDSIPLPLARRSGSALASLATGGRGSLSGGSLATTTRSATPTPATTPPAPPPTTATASPPPPTITDLPSAVTMPVSPPATVVAPPPITAPIEGVGSATQGLTSSNTSRGGVAATVKLTSVPRSSPVAQVITGRAASASTVSLATAATSSQTEAAAAKTPVAVLAPQKDSGIKAIGTSNGSSPGGGSKLQSQ